MGARRRAGDEKKVRRKNVERERERLRREDGVRGRMVGGGGHGGRTRRICRTRGRRAESECCPARKNGYSFSNVPDAHARFPAKRMAGVREGGTKGVDEESGGRQNEVS